MKKKNEHRNYFNSTVFEMGDKAVVAGNSFNQNYFTASQQSPLDLGVLALELNTLREALDVRVREPGGKASERYGDLTKVAQAEEAVQHKDEKTLLERLKAIGPWGLKIAREIGVNMVAGLIATGLTE